jgi:hypothetical protein
MPISPSGGGYQRLSFGGKNMKRQKRRGKFEGKKRKDIRKGEKEKIEVNLVK